jgi:hypothetical protein
VRDTGIGNDPGRLLRAIEAIERLSEPVSEKALYACGVA